MSCYKEGTEQLRKHGYRITPQRIMVLEALYHGDGFATAEEIWSQISQRHAHVDLSTVYRILQFLKDRGLVCEIGSAGGSTQYAAVHQETLHAHAVCFRCGQIFNVAPEWLAGLAETLAAQHTFQLDIANLEIPGLCQRCAENQTERTAS